MKYTSAFFHTTSYFRFQLGGSILGLVHLIFFCCLNGGGDAVQIEDTTETSDVFSRSNEERASGGKAFAVTEGRLCSDGTLAFNI